MPDLISPHGGLSTPVNRTVAKADLDSFASEVGSLTRVPVSAADLSTVYRFGDGALSPLEGPMGEAAWNLSLDEGVIENNGERYAWTIPMALPVSAELAATLSAGQSVALESPDGDLVAILDLTDVYEWDKPRYLESVYGTSREDHPGADMALKGDAACSHLLGGSIRVLPQPTNPAFGDSVKSPVEVRQMLADLGWQRVVAFQTRNPLHRAHEYALVYGLETLLKQGLNAGACLNPLVGETKGDDVNAEVRMQTYQALIESRGIGEGDSDPALWDARDDSVPDRVMLLGLDIKMYYGGPKEAVMHGIYRQNYGFTDIIIGRKHADAPFADGSAIWGDFDAQEIFGKLNGKLDIQTVNVGFAAYYESLGRVDLMENHDEEKPVFISGKDVRKTLLAGEKVDARIMREGTSDILCHHMAQGS